MKVISIINYKGGVGKTTVTSNLGAELAWRGYKVLLIDLDPQSSLTFSFITPEEWEENFSSDKTIKNWFDATLQGQSIDLTSLIFTPKKVKEYLRAKGRLDLISSHLGLINVDLELATGLGGASLKQAKENYLKVHTSLRDGLKAMKQDRYHVILIDCPPNFNIVTKNAIVASDNILIPAKADYLSTLGIDYLKRNLAALIKDYNEFVEVDPLVNQGDYIDPKILGVVFTMVQEYRRMPIAPSRQYIRQTKDLGIPVFDSYIKENKTIFADSSQDGVPAAVLQYSSASHERVVQGIESFVSEFERKVGLN